MYTSTHLPKLLASSTVSGKILLVVSGRKSTRTPAATLRPPKMSKGRATPTLLGITSPWRTRRQG